MCPVGRTEGVSETDPSRDDKADETDSSDSFIVPDSSSGNVNDYTSESNTAEGTASTSECDALESGDRVDFGSAPEKNSQQIQSTTSIVSADNPADDVAEESNSVSTAESNLQVNSARRCARCKALLSLGVMESH